MIIRIVYISNIAPLIGSNIMIISENSYRNDFKPHQTVTFRYECFRKAINSHRPPQLIMVNNHNYLKSTKPCESIHPLSIG